MKIYFLISTLYLTWTAQAYAKEEQTHSYNFLLARSLYGQPGMIKQTLSVRELAPAKMRTPAILGPVAQSLHKSLVKRTSPPASPRQRNSAEAANTNVQGGRFKSRAARASLAGVVGAGTIMSLGAMTDWSSPNHAYPTAVGMSCIGAITITAMCAEYLEKSKKRPKLRNLLPSIAQRHQSNSGFNFQASSSTELPPVLPVAGSPRASSSSSLDDPANLVRR